MSLCPLVSRPSWSACFAAPLILTAAVQARDTPLFPVGLQIREVAGVSSDLFYRDFAVADGVSPWGSFTLSGHGVTFSGWASASRRWGTTVHELSLAYSHKLPLLDVHLGLAQVGVPALGDSPTTMTRLTLSSNTWEKVSVDVTLDRSLEGSERLLTASASIALIRQKDWMLDARVSCSQWRRGVSDSAWGLRLIAARRLRGGPWLVPYLGYARSDASSSAARFADGGIVAGLSLGFR